MVRLTTQQIIVPSANLTNSPLALLPRSIKAPVGTPDDCDTDPTTSNSSRRSETSFVNGKRGAL